MAVWAHRPQVGHWVDLVLGANLRKRLEVMDVDEPRCKLFEQTFLAAV